MHEHAQDQQHLMTDQMSYEDILSSGAELPLIILLIMLSCH
jgi:hypothetical protein